MPRRRPRANLMALAVAALNAEPSPVILIDLAQRHAAHSIDRISEVSNIVFAEHPPHDHDLGRVRRFRRAPESVMQSLMPGAVKMLLETARADSRRNRDDVWNTPRPQTSEDSDAGESLVEIGALDSHARSPRDLQQPGHDRRHRFTLLDEGHRDGQALPMVNNLQGGVRVKMGRPAFGLGAPDFRLAGFRLPVIRQVSQIARDLDGFPLQALAQPRGEL